jgi:UDP-N-acetylmuramyl pentapeptide phosphotransferase/UDP-N-acetylglucosamine-1-phosphate transferase
MPVLFVVILIAVATYLLGFPVAKILSRLGAIDNPNARSSHSVPIVRGGGVAVILALLAGMVLMGKLHFAESITIMLAVLGLALVSFIDDLKSVGPAIRFGCHLAVALVVIAALNLAPARVGFTVETLYAVPVMLAWPLAVLWIAGYTNAFNFMDGINGIAGGQAAITGIGMALLSALASGQWSVVCLPALWSLALAGAALGFLPHNFPRARMFMGDVGSAPIGFLLAVLTLWLAKTVGWWLLVPLALLHANFVLDTGFTLVRRILKGERWYEPHREHFYQRLIRSGKTHSFVTDLEMALQVVVLGLMMLYLHANLLQRIGLVVLVVLIWLAFFGYSERSFLAALKVESRNQK